MNTLQSEWDNFKKNILPKNVSTLQYNETKKAFYAGGAAVLHILWNIGEEAISENAGAAMLENLQKEIKQFYEQLLQYSEDQ